ncbi:hypothetical protein H109_07065 [Trichophyton interdigitale MR816]|uniref:Uncharacterized protein n=1 Tax=Trichophyton interdigitale (strain MR816) TaxID=1215338 RepID=A0A059IZD4_TRIIM|nr:hypothetical protein H109_07065 [Trichophyton interdigitale MR816]
MTESHSCIKCGRSSESEHLSSPNIGSMAQPVSRRLKDHPKESEPATEAVVISEMDMIGSMMSQLQQLRSQFEGRLYKHGQELGNHLATIEDFKRQIKDRDKQIGQLNLSLENSSLTQGLATMQCQQEQLLNDLRIAQEANLRSIKATSWDPKEDREIRNEFSRLEERLRAWVRKYVVRDISRLRPLADFEKDAIVGRLKGSIARSTFDSLLKQMTPRLEGRFPFLIGHAMLAASIFDPMFSNPFFAIRYFNTNCKPISSSAMFGLYRRMGNASPSEAHIWRSQLLRFLTKPQPGSPESSLASPRIIESYSTGRAKLFLKGPIRLLLEAPKPRTIQYECLDDLCHIFACAMQLSLSLWCQRTQMACNSVFAGNTRAFLHTDPSMIAHRLHQLDEGENKLDGKEILLIIQPAVVAFGNEDGENYDKQKIWSPAIVLVNEKED